MSKPRPHLLKSTTSSISLAHHHHAASAAASSSTKVLGLVSSSGRRYASVSAVQAGEGEGVRDGRKVARGRRGSAGSSAGGSGVGQGGRVFASPASGSTNTGIYTRQPIPFTTHQHTTSALIHPSSHPYPYHHPTPLFTLPYFFDPSLPLPSSAYKNLDLTLSPIPHSPSPTPNRQSQSPSSSSPASATTSLPDLSTTHALLPSSRSSTHPLNSTYPYSTSTAIPSSLLARQPSTLSFNPGAYGLPKLRHSPPTPSAPGSTFLAPSETDDGELLHATQVGEDAYFLRPDSLGIADGVGGWSRRRPALLPSEGDEDAVAWKRTRTGGEADPGLFARLLMGFCEDGLRGYWERGDGEWMEDGVAASASGSSSSSASSSSAASSSSSLGFSNLSLHDSKETGGKRNHSTAESSAKAKGKGKRRILSPVEVMQRGYERCMECVKTEGIFGSSTCLLATLQDDELKIANLGDCACVVVRRGEIVFRTEEMQHSFNFPFQLGTNSKDEPMKDAEMFSVKVEEGDVVVMSSDGLVDNLFDEDILEVLSNFSPPLSPLSSSPSSTSASTLPPFSPQKVSEMLCLAAHAASEETGTASPFMCRAIEEGIDFLGGKRDDISVLVAVVQDGRGG